MVERTLELLQILNAVLAGIDVLLLIARVWLKPTRPKSIWRFAGLGFLFIGVGYDASSRFWQHEDGNFGTLVIFAALVFYLLGSMSFEGDEK